MIEKIRLQIAAFKKANGGRIHDSHPLISKLKKLQKREPGRKNKLSGTTRRIGREQGPRKVVYSSNQRRISA